MTHPPTGRRQDHDFQTKAMVKRAWDGLVHGQMKLAIGNISIDHVTSQTFELEFKKAPNFQFEHIYLNFADINHDSLKK